MMARLINVRSWRQGPPGRPRGVPAAASDDLQAIRVGAPDFSYVPPRIMVVGRIRNLSTGSSSSGKSDANSQFYW
jgi:hypothetical protein